MALRESLSFPLLLALSGMRRERPLLTVLSILAVASAVTLAAALEMSSRSFSTVLEQTITALAGRSQIEVVAGDVGIPESLLEELRALPEVEAAEPMIDQAFVATLPGGERLTLHVVGIDILSKTALRDYSIESRGVLVSDPLRLLADPRSVLVSQALARRAGLRERDSISIEWSGGSQALNVRGIILKGDLSEAFNGQIAIADVFALQDVLGRPGIIERVDIAVTPETTIQAALRKVEDLVAGRASTQLTTYRDFLDQRMAPLRTAVLIAVAIGVLIAALLSYGAFSLMVDRRRSELDFLRSCGLDNRGLVRLVLVEGLIVAVAGTAVGLLVGIPTAKATTSLLSGMSQYLQSLTLPILAPNSRTLVGAMTIGLAVSMLGLVQPTWSAARRSPLSQIRDTRPKGKTSSIRMLFLSLVAALIVVIGLALVPEPYRELGLVLVGLVGVALSLGAVFSRGLYLGRSVAEQLIPRIGRLAGTALVARPYAAGLTTAGLGLLSAAFITNAFVMESVTSSIQDEAVGRYRHGALYVATGPPVALDRPPLPAEAVTHIRSLSTVDDVAEYYLTSIRFRSKEVSVYAVDHETLYRYDGLDHLAGDTATTVRMLREGAVLVDAGFSKTFDVGPGDVVMLPTPNGLTQATIYAVVDGFSAGSGAVTVDISLFDRLWTRPGASWVGVWSSDPARLKALLAASQRGSPPFFVQDGQAMARQLGPTKQVEENAAYFFVLGSVWAAIGGIAMLTLLAGAVAERRGELRLLRAIGATRLAIRALVLIDGASIALLGSALGAIAGTLWALGALKILRILYGWPLQPSFRISWYVTSALAALAAAGIASLVAGGHARYVAAPGVLTRD